MGRKTLKDEAKAARAINRSWDWVDKALRSKKLSAEEKGKIALSIAQRSVPKNLNIKSDDVANLAEVMKSIYKSKTK